MFDFQDILFKHWGHKSFRDKQLDIIEACALHQRDVLALLPTGGGKSICFQVPALAMPGMCLVISPLIALMNDQVDQLKARGIEAASLTGQLNHNELTRILDRCVNGQVKFLYLAPERLLSANFQAYLQNFNLNLIAIDEAHCISQWGYDFRPAYLQLVKLKELFPNVPTMALTASATPKVQQDIIDKLGLKDVAIFKRSFYRDNLGLFVVNTSKKHDYLYAIIRKNEGSGLVYCSSRKTCVQIADWLKKAKVASDFYHAGLSPLERIKKQNDWIQGNTRVMVCTNAFGMGIDKADVRFVVHWNNPSTLEAYYQEAGRGGRDGQKSFGITLFNSADVKQMSQQVEDQFPQKELVKKVYTMIGNYFQLAYGSGKGVYKSFRLQDFADYAKIPANTCMHALNILKADALIDWTEAFAQPSRVRIAVSYNKLYEFQVLNKPFEALIQILLRAYAGIFEEAIKIDEWYLAKKLNSTVDYLIRQLKHLHELEIIDYQIQAAEPALAFTTERLVESNFRISSAAYELRRETLKAQSEAMVNFLTQSSACRFKVLCHYFGEDNNELRCGKCDVCLAEQKKKNTYPLADAVKNTLGFNNMVLESLVTELEAKYNTKEIYETLDWMQGKGIIKVDHLRNVRMADEPNHANNPESKE